MIKELDDKGSVKRVKGPEKAGQKRGGTEVATPASGEVSFQVMADKFIAAFDTKLTAPQIINKMTKEGFPAGLAADLGEGFSNFIEDARIKLSAVDPSDPELSNALRQSVSRKMTEYFGSQRATIERFYAVSKDPAGYLKTVSALFFADEAKAETLPYSDLNSALLGISRFSNHMALVVLEIIAKKVANEAINSLPQTSYVGHPDYVISRTEIIDVAYSVPVTVDIRKTFVVGRVEDDELGKKVEDIFKEHCPKFKVTTQLHQGMMDNAYTFSFSLPKEMRKKQDLKA